MARSRPSQILIVTGMSGAGKSTALRTLEDLGWEVVDNLPLRLLDRLLAVPPGEGSEHGRPLAIGIDSRTRDFDAQGIISRLDELRRDQGQECGLLFLDCGGSELSRRFSETRRRHPFSSDERTLIEAYPVPEMQPWHRCSMLHPAVLDSDWRFLVGYHGDEPVGTAAAFVTSSLTLVELVSSHHRLASDRRRCRSLGPGPRAA